MNNLTIADILTPGQVKLDIECTSKKRALEMISQIIAGTQEKLESWLVFDTLVARERLGSTAVGRGIAIPHGKLAGLEKPVGAFLRLKAGIDFDSADDLPVRLIFAILVPEGGESAHLAILGQLARRFSDPEFCMAIRDAQSSEVVFSLLTRKIVNVDEPIETS
ncbi:MAG: PTS sugar transporter subunit IIA [Halothiobacillaceae bacterium]|nr:MAG: PTS sugar transporter subunit IIA [Halothiobacillaceae bacterium]